MSVTECKWLSKGQNFVFHLAGLRKYKKLLEIWRQTATDPSQITDEREDAYPPTGRHHSDAFEDCVIKDV